MAPELVADLPTGLQLDGELVAFDAHGRPDFHRLSACILHGRPGIPVTYFVFDVLAVESHSDCRQARGLATGRWQVRDVRQR